jgi:glycerol-3-phosphate dehydrogenase
VIAEDTISGKTYTLHSKVVINATGVFADDIMQMDDEQSENFVSPSQGIHFVIDKKFFPGNYAMMIPETDDGRVLFAVPWHNKVIVGTTDTPVQEPVFEPTALEEEIAFIFRNINRYLISGITKKDIKTVFAGLRPLVKAPGQKNTAFMPRDHTIIVSKANLVTITGGKWTTYRKMAKDAIDNAVFASKQQRRQCKTQTLQIHGWCTQKTGNEILDFYGSDAAAIQQLMNDNPSLKEKLHPDFEYTKAQVIWAIQHEMAITIEDILARRIRLLFLDAHAALQAAPIVASIMMTQLNKDESWVKNELDHFFALAQRYMIR